MSSKLRRRQKRRQQRRLQDRESDSIMGIWRKAMSRRADPTAEIPWATMSRWADPKFLACCQNPSGVKVQIILVHEYEPLFWSHADMVKLLDDMARLVKGETT